MVVGWDEVAGSGTGDEVEIVAGALCAVLGGNVADTGIDEGTGGVADKAGEEVDVSLGRQAVCGGLERVCARFVDGEYSCFVGVALTSGGVAGTGAVGGVALAAGAGVEGLTVGCGG